MVFDAPHSGSVYPDDFRPAVSLGLLQGGEDRFVDRLVAGAPDAGATLVAAKFARTYIDPNRDLDEIDETILEAPWPGPTVRNTRTELGVGLVFSKIGPDIDIYDRRLSVAEIDRRIERYWRRYHAALDGALDRAAREHGGVWHLNCHSMTPVGNDLSPDPGRMRPDFVLGDLFGTSCEPAFTELVGATLTGMGYSVGLNEPYAGAYIVERNGRPDKGRHSLQMEINRGLYMDLDSLERNAGFARLKAAMGELAGAICRFARQSAKATAQ